MGSKKDTIGITTLGCPKNIVDSEVLMKQLLHNRRRLTDDADTADVAIINTCGFIESAKRESIDTIVEAVERKKEGRLKKIVVMGCLSERYRAELEQEFEEVDAFVGANAVDQVVAAIGGTPSYELLGERLLTTPSHFAYLKISEGCDNPCSFCAIPLMRGKHASKPAGRVLLEARRLAALGVKELVLIAQDSTSYGLDLVGKRVLATLLEQLASVDGIEWIRLMYAYPAKFPLDLLEQFRGNPKLCRYLDLPVQHVSDPVLKSMRRGIGSRALRRLLETLRKGVPGIALRTTIIVGYPNEGKKEFGELLSFVKEFEFDRLGVFTYSLEEGTTAYPLGDPVPPEEKEERRRIIMETQREISLRKNHGLVGKTVRVLIDRVEGDDAIGRTERDAPEIDNEVVVHSGRGAAVGSFLDATVVDADEYDLYAALDGRPF